MSKKSNEDIEIRKVHAGINKNVAKMNWKCMFPGCNQKACNTHLLQRHGVLSNIVEDGHCYELRETDVFAWSKDNYPMEFKRCGLQNAISHPIFCDHHDSELFKPIETGVVDYDDYHNQLLLSYRTICSEIRRKEIVIKRYQRYLGSNILQSYRKDYLDMLPGTIEWSKAGIKDMMFYKEAIEKEIEESDHKFRFVRYTYPIKGVYASSHFSLGNLEETANLDEVMPDCIGHVVPNGENTDFIFGYHKDHTNKAVLDFVNGWGGLDKEQLGERLTGWFTLIESWGLAPSLYNKIKSDDLKRYYYLLENSFHWVVQNPNIGFNMFSGIL